MKVVKQNGARHVLSRREVEAMIPAFPAAWGHDVTSILLCQTSEVQPSASYHPKEKTLALYWPTSLVSPDLKSAAVEELCVAFAALADLGHLPSRLSGHRRADYSERTLDVQKHCTRMFDSHPDDVAEAPHTAGD